MTRIFPYKDKTKDSVLIQGNKGPEKTRIWAYFTQCVKNNSLKNNLKIADRE